jgi:HEAT repeat protein
MLPLCLWAAEQTPAGLAKQLESPDREIRREATYQLARIGEPAKEALPALIKALGDEDKQVWSNAITAIANLGPAAESAIPVLIESFDGQRRGGGRRQYDRQQIVLRSAYALSKIGAAAVPPLLEAMRSDDIATRVGVAKAFGGMGEVASPAVSALVGNLGSGEDELRREVVDALGAIGKPSVGPLVEALNSSDARTQEGACLALAQIGMPDAAPAADRVLELAEKDGTISVKGAALRAIPRVGADPAKASTLLLASVRGSDETLRKAATGALLTSKVLSAKAVPSLAADLKDADAGKRHQAAQVLGRMNIAAAEAVPALIAAAWREPTEDVYAAALAQIGMPALDPLLKELTNPADKDATKRTWVFRALRGMGSPAMDALVPALDSPEIPVRAGAVRALEGMPLTPDAIKRLLALTEDPAPEVRAASLRVLASVRSQRDIVTPKLDVALQDPNPDVRRAAAVGLASFGAVAKVGAPGLLELLQEPEVATRRSAIEALGGLGPAAAPAVPAIADRLTDPALQITALEALGKIGPESTSAVPKIIEFAKTGSEEQRLAAMQALGNIGQGLEGVLPMLYEALKSQNRDMRIAALQAIPKVEKDDAKVLEILGNALEEESGRIRRVALDASKRLGSRAEPLVPKILVLLDRDADRPVALATLREIPVRSVKTLVSALNHRDAAVRAFACDALGKLGSDAIEAVPLLQEKAEKDSDNVRAAAKRALERIPSAAPAAPPAKEAS